MDDLKGRLLFHNTMDVWMTLCRENGWDWREFSHYREFLEYLRSHEIEMRKASGGHPIKIDDPSGKELETYTVRLDSSFVILARRFTPSD